MLLSSCCKHAATWQRCHSNNKVTAVVTESLQRRNTNMFLFSSQQAKTNQRLILLTWLVLPSVDSGPFFQEEHPGSCDSEHSPELLEDHLRQEEYDRCEHDVGTFRNQKLEWLLVLQNTTRQMLKGKMCLNVGFFKDPMCIPCVYSRH